MESLKCFSLFEPAKSSANHHEQENYASPATVCQLNQFKDYTSLLTSKLPFLNNSDTNDLDNASIKSETLSNASIADPHQTKMTISDDQKPQFSSLASLLNANFLESDAGKPASLLEQMFLMNQAAGQTAEQPLDLSLHPKKELDLNDINLLTSLYANTDSLAGKIKK